jgi:hypothetical protein
MFAFFYALARVRLHGISARQGGVPMKFEISTASVLALLLNPNRPHPHRFCLTSLRILTDEEITSLLEPSCRRLVVYQYTSQVA